jgi:bacteriocin biosynthesis cyclodehydratase domain-containing protein
MVLQLLPETPMVWRTPTSVPFGIDAPVVIDEVGTGVERLLAALRPGISPSGYAMLARDAGVPPADADAVLDALAPLLVGTPAARDDPPATVRVTGSGPFAETLAALLSDEGVLARAEDPAPGLVALVADWVVPPDDAAHWLRRDIPHLPVVVTDRSVSIGPFVEPGRGPCIYCVQLARTDADAAWPAVASQLWGRPGATHPRITVMTVATFAARRIAARLSDGPADAPTVWRVSDRGATISAATTRLHPRCSCAAPPESDWAAGPVRADPAATSSGPGASGRA